jgi:hypothetical protein
MSTGGLKAPPLPSKFEKGDQPPPINLANAVSKKFREYIRDKQRKSEFGLCCQTEVQDAIIFCGLYVN